MKIKTLLVAFAALVMSASAFAQEQEPSIELNNTYAEAMTAIKAKDFGLAIEKLNKAMELANTEDNFDYVLKVQKYLPTCYLYSGNRKAGAKDTAGAVADFEKAIELGTLYSDAKVVRGAKTNISKVYKMMGAGAFNSKDYASAAEVFAKGYEANPQDTDLGLYLAMSYCEMKDFENGVKVYTNIIDLENRHSKFIEPANQAKEKISYYLLLKAQEEIAAGNKEAAYATLETLTNAIPENYTNNLFRLQTAAGNNDWDKVIEWGNASAAKMATPEEQSEIYYLVAVAHDTKNENDKAIETYKLVTAGDKLAASKKRAAELEEFVKAQKEHNK